MRPSLAAEVRAFLVERGPHQSKEIARNVRARRADVDAVLAQDGFQRVAPPDGAYPRGEYWDASRCVPSARGGKSRADVLLSILRDGEPHTRDEIFAAAGGFFHTNNAAAELRSEGHVVEYLRAASSYRLIALAEQVAA